MHAPFSQVLCISAIRPFTNKTILKSGRYLKNWSVVASTAEFNFLRHFASSSGSDGIKNGNKNARRFAGVPRLREIGRLDNVKVNENYEPGQTFLHRIFAYRAVVLFSWTATVYDCDINTDDGIDADDKSVLDAFNPKAELQNAPLKKSLRTFYQVLADERDLHYLRSLYQDNIHANKDDPFLALYDALKGFAYVSHDDILPYTPTDFTPIQNEHMERFLTSAPGSSTNFMETPYLKKWRARCQISEIHRETSQNIRITVMPFFLAGEEKEVVKMASKKRTYCWLFSVQLENFSTEPVYLQGEEWSIFDSDMRKIPCTEKLIGKAVPEPLLSLSYPAFQSRCRVLLPTKSGYMWGRLTMYKENGTPFFCRIPAVNLESKN